MSGFQIPVKSTILGNRPMCPGDFIDPAYIPLSADAGNGLARHGDGLYVSATALPPLNIQTIVTTATAIPAAANDMIVITGQTVPLTITNPAAPPTDGHRLTVRVFDNGTTHSIAFGSAWKAVGAPLPTATTPGSWTYVEAVYNATSATFDVLDSSVLPTVNFQQNGAGSVLRLMQDKGRENISILDFGPDGGPNSGGADMRLGVLDCIPYLNAALASVKTVVGNSTTGPRIRFPPGTYFFNTPSYGYDLKQSCILEGDTVVLGLRTSSLIFPTDSCGFVINQLDTGAGGTVAATTKASGTIIRNLGLTGLTQSTNPACYGIWIRARGYVENCFIQNFYKGIAVIANSAGSGANRGNANGFHIYRNRIQNCAYGITISGSDTNAGMTELNDISTMSYCGIWDKSFLGNTHVQNQVASVGLLGQVSDGINRYYCIDDTGAASTAVPSTSPAQWQLIGAGGTSVTYPLWVSGTAYLQGNGYRGDTTELNARNTWNGNYTESAAGPSEFGPLNQWYGGSTGGLTVNNSSRAFIVSGGSNGAQLTGFEQNANPSSTNLYNATYSELPDTVHSKIAVGDHSAGLADRWDNVNGMWMVEHAGSLSRVPIRYSTNLSTTVMCGRLAAIGGGQIVFGQGFYLGSTLANARNMTNSSTTPVTIGSAVGEIQWDRTPTPGDAAGWICVVQSPDGIANDTWSRFGTIELSASETFDWPSIANATSASTDIAVTGAAAGDFATASMSVSLQGLGISASVKSANLVTVVLTNLTGGAIDLASATLRVRVTKH